MDNTKIDIFSQLGISQGTDLNHAINRSQLDVGDGLSVSWDSLKRKIIFSLEQVNTSDETVVISYLTSHKTKLNIESAFLHNEKTNARIVLEASNNASKDLGEIVSLGSNTTINFDKIKGRCFTVISTKGSWFSLINNYSTIPSNSKKIETDKKDIKEVVSATFVLNENLVWKLVNYEKLNRDGCSLYLWETWGKKSTASIPLKTHDPNEEIILEADKQHFYKVTVKGKFSKHILDNSASWDYSATGLFVFLLSKKFIGDPWTYSEAKHNAYDSGDYIEVDSEFIAYTEDDLIVAPIYSHNNIQSAQIQHSAIQNHDRFELETEIFKICKTKYFKTFDIPETIGLGDTFTYTSSDLPFDGYYKVDVFVACEEKEITGATNLNQTQARTLTIESNSDLYSVCDVSNIHTPMTNIHDMLVFSLQGSRIIKAEDEGSGRNIKAKVYMPVGLNNKVNHGYMNIKYLGTEETTFDIG